MRHVVLCLLLAACSATFGGPKDSPIEVDPVAPGDTDVTVAAPGDGGFGTSPTGGTGAEALRYHPADYSNPDRHGLDSNLHAETCTDCHGDDLTGRGDAASCDTCHSDGWRTNCTYCHGGDDNSEGAPPGDIDGESNPAAITFTKHTEHVTMGSGTHGPFDCSQCHSTPQDVLTPGHMYDATPAVAEVDFSAGLSHQGNYNMGSCTQMYCHGNGQAHNGRAEDDPTFQENCGTCHGGYYEGGWGNLSGEHSEHLGEGVACWDCHGNTTQDAQTINNPALHVNGRVNVQMPNGITYNGNTCTGSCHGEGHSAERW